MHPGTARLIAGESYGGVYVPMLAQAVLDGNDAGALPQLNLKARATTA
jgi:carboxypeptidase C (cathepsin A)